MGIISWTVRLPPRSYCKLLFDSQHVINSVHNRVLPLDIILQSKNILRRAGIEFSARRNGWFLARDDRQAFLQLRPGLSEELYRLLPRKRARGYDEPLRRIAGRGYLEREQVCTRDVTYVDVQRRKADRRIEPAHRATRCPGDELVGERVRRWCGRVVDLARPEGPVDVRRMDRGQIYLWMCALKIAHNGIREPLRD